jgi:hypothetical protein
MLKRPKVEAKPDCDYCRNSRYIELNNGTGFWCPHCSPPSMGWVVVLPISLIIAAALAVALYIAGGRP